MNEHDHRDNDTPLCDVCWRPGTHHADDDTYWCGKHWVQRKRIERAIASRAPN